jgi:hypothetical protein
MVRTEISAATRARFKTEAGSYFADRATEAKDKLDALGDKRAWIRRRIYKGRIDTAEESARSAELSAEKSMDLFEHMKNRKLTNFIYDQAIYRAVDADDDLLAQALRRDRDMSADEGYIQHKSPVHRLLMARVVEQIALVSASETGASRTITLSGSPMPTDWNPLANASGYVQEADFVPDMLIVRDTYNLLGLNDYLGDIPDQMPRRWFIEKSYTNPQWQTKFTFIYEPPHTRTSGEDLVRSSSYIDLKIEKVY